MIVYDRKTVKIVKRIVRMIMIVENDDIILEREPLEKLASDGQLVAYRHESFWQCMDTLRHKQLLEDLWKTNQAPWKSWS